MVEEREFNEMRAMVALLFLERCAARWPVCKQCGAEMAMWEHPTLGPLCEDHSERTVGGHPWPHPAEKSARFSAAELALYRKVRAFLDEWALSAA